MVMAMTTVRYLDLVVPLAHEATAMRTTETATIHHGMSGAVSRLSDRPGDVECTIGSSTSPTPATPGIRTSTTATRTTTTRTKPAAAGPSADQAFTLADLVQAYLDCRRTKRNKPSALAFEQNLERNLCDLHDELQAGTYRPGRSICFVITHPKPREVWAADFRDRIVHHLLYNHVGPRIEASFIVDSCACIPGRGTLYAAKRLEAKVHSITQNWSQPAHYLKLDLANFFVSIDKRILRDLLARNITETWWLQLAETILFHDPRQNFELKGRPQDLAMVPPHKRLANHDCLHGLPIGNLSSQFYANILLDALDRHIKHELHCRHYVRYVDDMVLLHHDTDWLNAARQDIEAWLPANLRLAINPRKTIMQPVERGIDFVGHIIKPWRRIARRKTLHVALDRTALTPDADLLETANSYFGLLRQASHSHHDRTRLANLLRKRGHCISGDITKTYRKENHA